MNDDEGHVVENPTTPEESARAFIAWANNKAGRVVLPRYAETLDRLRVARINARMASRETTEYVRSLAEQLWARAHATEADPIFGNAAAVIEHLLAELRSDD